MSLSRSSACSLCSLASFTGRCDTGGCLSCCHYQCLCAKRSYHTLAVCFAACCLLLVVLVVAAMFPPFPHPTPTTHTHTHTHTHLHTPSLRLDCRHCGGRGQALRPRDGPSALHHQAGTECTGSSGSGQGSCKALASSSTAGGHICVWLLTAAACSTAVLFFYANVSHTYEMRCRLCLRGPSAAKAQDSCFRKEN